MFGNVYNGKKVLVTGNTGFKGSWLTAWLLKLGARVFGLSKDVPSQPSMFEALDLSSGIAHTRADVRQLEETAGIITDIQPDFVFHLAAQALVSESYRDPVSTLSTNVLGTAHVLEGIRRLSGPCTGVIITSDKCYENLEWPWGYRETDRLGGKDIYSGSKSAAEMVIHSYFHSFFKDPESLARVAVTRAGNVIGGGDWARDRIVPDCMKAWSAGQRVAIRRPEATRPWQHVLEPLSGYLHLGEQLKTRKELNGEAYNFGPPARQNQSVLALLTAMADLWDGAAYQSVPSPGNYEAGLLKLNCDKALADLQWQSTLDFSQTVKMTVDWYRAFYEAGPDRAAQVTGRQIDDYVGMATAKSAVWTKDHD